LSQKDRSPADTAEHIEQRPVALRCVSLNGGERGRHVHRRRR
jgi:hypothetical protein